MRFLLSILILTLTSAVSNAATPITKDMANSYYNNCISKKGDQKLTKESQDFLCSCTAAQMMDSMSVEDVQAMSTQDQRTARRAFNKMLINVYAPCMEYPAKDHYYNTCLSNPQTKKLGGNPEKLCGCMSDKVATHLKQNGKELFTGILKRNPNVTDPMAALEADKQFQNYVGKQALSCVF